MLNQLLARQIHEAIAPRQPGRCSELECERSLRVAAATLSGAQSDEITATTVVGTLGRDDVAAVEALVAAIAREFGLESRVRTNVGSYSVRFSRTVQEGR
jgi:hypothetical protein